MPKPEKRKQEVLTCDTCGIEVNSQQMMDAHIRGQKHIKKMKLKVEYFLIGSIFLYSYMIGRFVFNTNNNSV